MYGWLLSSAGGPGTAHLRQGINYQDSHRILITPTHLIGFLTDGCSSSPHSEVFAQLSTEFMLRTTHRLLLDSPTPEQLSHQLFALLLDYLSLSLTTQGLATTAQREEFISSFALFTLLGLVVTPTQAFILTCGDGIVIVNDNLLFLDQQNQPHYPAYNLCPSVIYHHPELVHQGFELWEFNPATFHTLGVASDAFVDHPELLESVATRPHTTIQLQLALNRWTRVHQLLADDATTILVYKDGG